MTLEEIDFLRGEGATVLSELGSAKATDPLAVAAKLRKTFAPEPARLLQEQAELRRRASAKFGEAASRMLFTKRLLEQASGRDAAAWKARRFREAGWTAIADLCCGSGGDALELARAGLDVELVDLDPAALELARHNLSVQGLCARAFDPVALPALPTGLSSRVFHLDPDRRTGGRDQGEDRWDHRGLSPDLDGIRALAARFEAGAVKLSPGAPEGALEIPAETEFVGIRDELREQVVWTGSLARAGHLTVSEMRDGEWETFAAPKRDAEAAFAEGLAEAPSEWVFEPVKAMVRSHLFSLFGGAHGLRRMDAEIAWLTGDASVRSNFLKAYRVLAHGPLKAGAEESLLRGCGRSCGAVKKRGVAVVPEKALKALKGLPGDPAVLVYTRVRDAKWILAVEPAANEGGAETGS